MKTRILAATFLIGLELAAQSSKRFVDYGDNPVVLAPGAKGEWDAGAIGSVSVIKVADTYHLYYEAWGELSGGPNSDWYKSLRIGHATSKDGIHWTKDSANPVLAAGEIGEWDHDGTWDPFVIHEDGVFKLWYGGGVGTHCDWGYATSTNGSHFEKKGQISHLGNVEDDHVVHNPDDGKYYMFYWDREEAKSRGTSDPLQFAPSGLRVAASNDATHFDFENSQWVHIDGQTWPVKYPQVVREGKKWFMFYGERHFIKEGAVVMGRSSVTGMAISGDLVHWSKQCFPIVKGHDAEVLNVGDNTWFLYYGADGYFDMPRADVRLAIHRGKLSELSDD